MPTEIEDCAARALKLETLAGELLEALDGLVCHIDKLYPIEGQGWIGNGHRNTCVEVIKKAKETL